MSLNFDLPKKDKLSFPKPPKKILVRENKNKDLVKNLSDKEKKWINDLFSCEKPFKDCREFLMSTYNISENSANQLIKKLKVKVVKKKEKGSLINIFTNLTQKDKEEIKSIYKKSKTRKQAQEHIASKYNIRERTVRKWANKLGIIGNENEYTKEFLEALDKAKSREVKGNLFFVSWGQQSTPVHKGFIKNMKADAKKVGAEILIIGGRYKNPTSIFKNDEEDNWWDKEIEHLLTLNRHNVHPKVSILSDVKIVPTAVTPLTGFEGFGAGISCVVGHPRVHLQIVAASEGYSKKEMFTTGACTVSNYTDSKAGKKGEFHHTLGFVVVECVGDEFHIRHVTADDKGDYVDINREVKNGKVKTIKDPLLAYCCGDKHFIDVDPEMEKKSREMITKLKPEYVRLDDVFDGKSINPHEANNPIQKYLNYKNGLNVLSNELDHLKENLNWYNDQDFKVVVPRCNHDIFLDRFIIDSDWKRDVANARTYVKCAALLMDEEAPKGLIPYFINEWFPEIICLDEDESFSIGGFEMSVHGHRGANGSRGSSTQFKKMSTKMVTNHTHTPFRADGLVTGGTNTFLRLGYTKGASGWLHCDTIITKNGKAQQLIFHNYECSELMKRKFK